jgi:hypothetical protein
MTLCEPNSFHPPNAQHAVSLNLASKQPYVEAEIAGSDGAPIHALLEIDTGKVDPFSISAAFARKNGLMKDGSKLLSMKGVSLGGETQAWMSRAKDVHFANVKLTKPIMGIAEEDGDRAGQLGYGVLRRFRITFDYSRKRAYFLPNADAGEPYQFDHAGFVLGKGGRHLSTLTAFMVFAGTSAADAGIQQGDEIVAIGNRPASAFTLEPGTCLDPCSMQAARRAARAACAENAGRQPFRS